MVKKKAEEALQEEDQQELQEVQKDLPLEETQAKEQTPAELAKIQHELEEQKERYKDLSRRLTQTQQENAELYRYHKATLPKINQSFAERWEQSPEHAVDSVIETKVQPVNVKLAQMEARQWETEYLVDHPDMTKFRTRVLELGDEHPHLTSYKSGITKLYEMAEAETLREELKKLKSNGRAEAEKERAFTESGSPKLPSNSRQIRRLDAIQRRVAQELGIKEDEYVKRLEEVEAR